MGVFGRASVFSDIPPSIVPSLFLLLRLLHITPTHEGQKACRAWVQRLLTHGKHIIIISTCLKLAGQASSRGLPSVSVAAPSQSVLFCFYS
jgi:hypothetical protein